MRSVEVPVLIVGGGPVGMVASILLAGQGIRNLVIERREGPHTSPQAHILNCRTMEVFRAAGIETAVRAAETGNVRYVRWVSTLAGDEFGRLDLAADPERVRLRFESTPSPAANVSQHLLEPVLAEALRGCELSTLEFGQEWQDLEQDTKCVCSRVLDRESGDVYEVRSRYLLAADGAGSHVRKALGIDMIGPTALGSFVMVHFEANLRDLVRERPGILYWVAEPDAVGTLIAHDIDKTWVFMKPYDPDASTPDDFSEDVCAGLVRRAIGDDSVAFRIRSISPWTMTAQVASRYRFGRAFLVGDAAHRFPPTGGIGLNTGVQDAHNLTWKLQAVEAGRAGSSLLYTYQEERRDVAKANSDQSLSNARKMVEVVQALGITADPEETRASFAAVLRDEARRAAVQAAIDDQIDHFDMLALDLGFSYESAAVIPDGSPKPVGANPTRDFIPTTRPGSRLPHAWVTRGGTRVSTLDLVAYDRFTLLTGARGKGWVDAAARHEGVPLACVRIGAGGDAEDPEGAWQRVCEIDADGALLLRPDGHVAWRARTAVEDPVAVLEAALQRILAT
jgi:2,4-dichlorophenol 6-monooxygenase